MANQTVDQLSPTLNIHDTDLIEITVDNGDSSFTSYNMEFGEFKKNIITGQGVKLTFLAAGVQTYGVSRYEKVIGYTFVQTNSTDTVKITDNATSDIIVDTTDDNARDFKYYSTDSTASNRVLKVELSAAGTIYLHSIKNLVP